MAAGISTPAEPHRAPAKGGGKGTGLGLHISHQLWTQAGGTLGFETGPTGTTFAVDLPRAA